MPVTQKCATSAALGIPSAFAAVWGWWIFNGTANERNSASRAEATVSDNAGMPATTTQANSDTGTCYVGPEGLIIHVWVF